MVICCAVVVPAELTIWAVTNPISRGGSGYQKIREQSERAAHLRGAEILLESGAGIDVDRALWHRVALEVVKRERQLRGRIGVVESGEGDVERAQFADGGSGIENDRGRRNASAWSAAGALFSSVSVNVMVPAVVPVWNAMLDWPPIVAAVSPMAMLTVAMRRGPDRNWMAASSVTPATLD